MVEIPGKVLTCQTVFDGAVDVSVECDIVIPDYLPAAVRVCRADAMPAVKDVLSSKDRISLEGAAELCVFYIGEGGGLQMVRQTAPFSQNVDVPGVKEDSRVLCDVSTDRVTARLQSSRRLSVRATFWAGLRCENSQAVELPPTEEWNDMELLTGEMSASEPAGLVTKVIAVEEEIEVPPSLPAIGELVRCQPTCVVSETKPIAGKIVVKGSARLTFLYRTSEGALRSMENEIPFTSVFDMPDVDDACGCFVAVRSCTGEYKVFENGDGENRFIGVTLELTVEAAAYRNRKFGCVLDAFSTKYACETKIGELKTEYVAECPRLQNVKRVKAESEEELIRVITSSASARLSDVSLDGRMLTVGGRLRVWTICENSDGGAVSLEKEEPFEITAALEEVYGEVSCLESVAVEGVNASIAAGGVELRVSLSVGLLVRAAERVRYVSDVSVDEGKKLPRRSGVLLCYPYSGETLWSIAKRYHVGQSGIQSANELSDDNPMPRVLLVPRA